MPNSKRLEAFHALEKHPWLGRIYGRLTKAELAFCQELILANEHLSKGDFELKINRLWLDREERPKNRFVISELLICANSAMEAK